MFSTRSDALPPRCRTASATSPRARARGVRGPEMRARRNENNTAFKSLDPSTTRSRVGRTTARGAASGSGRSERRGQHAGRGGGKAAIGERNERVVGEATGVRGGGHCVESRRVSRLCATRCDTRTSRSNIASLVCHFVVTISLSLFIQDGTRARLISACLPASVP